MQSENSAQKVVSKPVNWKKLWLKDHLLKPEATRRDGNTKMAIITSAIARDSRYILDGSQSYVSIKGEAEKWISQ